MRCSLSWRALSLVMGVVLGGLQPGCCQTGAGSAAEGEEQPVDEFDDGSEHAAPAELLIAQATQYQRQREWYKLADTLEEAIRLRPKYSRLRKLAAWNLVYNISAAQTDVKDRYAWLCRGILVFGDGIDVDPENVECWSGVARNMAFKLGIDDESREFRRLFSEDKRFHNRLRQYVPVEEATGPNGLPDNWLVGRLFFNHISEMIQKDGASQGNIPQIVQFGRSPACTTGYAAALYKDGYFGETAVLAWRNAEREWQALGDCESTDPSGFSIRLNDQDRMDAEVVRLWKEFDGLQPGLHQRLQSEALAALPDALRKVLEKPASQRANREADAARRAEDASRLTLEKLDKVVSGANRGEALRIAEQALAAERKAEAIRSFRASSDYDELLLRCKLEQSEGLREARRLTYEAERLWDEGDSGRGEWKTDVRKRYEEAFRKWAVVLQELGERNEVWAIREDLTSAVTRYRERILNNGPLPAGFPIGDKIQEWERARRQSLEKWGS